MLEVSWKSIVVHNFETTNIDANCPVEHNNDIYELLSDNFVCYNVYDSEEDTIPLG